MIVKLDVAMDIRQKFSENKSQSYNLISYQFLEKVLIEDSKDLFSVIRGEELPIAGCIKLLKIDTISKTYITKVSEAPIYYAFINLSLLLGIKLVFFI
jgi:hypothetical protein